MVSAVSFRSFRFDVSPFSTCPLNICEKLKMTQRDTGNIKSKVNETCCCETCHI